MCPRITSFAAIFLLLVVCSLTGGRSIPPDKLAEEDGRPLELYPETSSERPRILSPHRLPDGTEVLIARLQGR